MDEAASASLDTLVTQNAAMLHTMAAAYGPQEGYAALQDVLGELLADAGEGLVYVRIGRPDGALLVSAGLPTMTVLPPPHPETGGRLQGGLGDALIHVRRPLLLDRNEVGFLQFGVSVSVLAAARRAILEQGTAIAVAEVVLTFVLLSLIGYLLTRNLGRLLAGSQALAEGHLDHRLKEEGSDELARLAQRFNIMAERLQARIGELEDTAVRLHASEERYALAIRGANDGLWDWNIAAGTLYLSPRCSEIAGLSAGELKVAPAEVFAHLHPDDIGRYRDQLVEHLKGDSAQFMLEHRVRMPDDSYRWVLIRGVAQRDAAGRACRMAGSVGDVHVRRQAQQRLLHDALHDGLTGLPNRALFIEHLNSALGQQRRNDDFRFAVLTINLERFRLINDSFGHVAGDELLRSVADRIGRRLRGGDVAARIGGDQFAILLNGVGNRAEAPRFAAALREQLAQPATVAGHAVYPKARIGVALSDDYGDDAEAILRDADNALHRARRSPDEAVTIFESGMHAQTLLTLRLESGLRAALRERTLIVHYQPIVSLADRGLASFEALVRWPHADKGLLPPQDFVPLAETLDLIHELGMLVLDLGCADIVRWQAACGTSALPPVSINLSARQFLVPDLPQQLLDTVARHGLPPAAVRVEVTESALAAAAGPAPAMLAALRQAGMKVLIDDFGTGYSALSYLHTIPCDVIKLDGSFVRTLAGDARLGAIVRRSIALAHDLGMTVVAESIETAEQEALLRTMGCDFGQGYLYARPLDADAVARLLASAPHTKELIR
ncbi:EAL domain-containing protein [Pseudothauera rhizosphaerae]|uniref:EAL domain-containing protein n=2 Tax=Pseudothauera rhizosphaerae TaxID=2565932 RepID=A0A4S4AZ32_9RHOO|nr:EAL domain-containing protein [Pseudothauera rhizosphaerae]